MTSHTPVDPRDPRPHLKDLKPSPTLLISEQMRERRARGASIFAFGFGQSPFPVPERVINALRQSASAKDYLAVQGLKALRERVAEWHLKQWTPPMSDAEEPQGERPPPPSINADEIMIGPGSKELIFLIQLAHQGRLTLPQPSWVSYAPQAQLLSHQVDWVPTTSKDRWLLSADGLESICLSTPSVPRLLILNSPNNPTGQSYEHSDLRALARVCRKYNVTVISDEIYGALHFDGDHPSLSSYYPEGTIVTGGLSKWCGAGGWRLGTAYIPPQLNRIKETLCAIASETFSAVSAPIQHAACVAYTPHPEIDRYLSDSRRLLSALGAHCAERLRSAGVEVHDPQGGFYIYPDFSPARASFEARGLMTSADVCGQLLRDTGVALLPGIDFGHDDEEAPLTARLSFVDFDGANALSVLAELPADAPIDQTLLESLCPATLEGIEALRMWLNSI